MVWRGSTKLDINNSMHPGRAGVEVRQEPGILIILVARYYTKMDSSVSDGAVVGVFQTFCSIM